MNKILLFLLVATFATGISMALGIVDVPQLDKTELNEEDNSEVREYLVSVYGQPAMEFDIDYEGLTPEGNPYWHFGDASEYDAYVVEVASEFIIEDDIDGI